MIWFRCEETQELFSFILFVCLYVGMFGCFSFIRVSELHMSRLLFERKKRGYLHFPKTRSFKIRMPFYPIIALSNYFLIFEKNQVYYWIKFVFFSDTASFDIQRWFWNNQIKNIKIALFKRTFARWSFQTKKRFRLQQFSKEFYPGKWLNTVENPNWKPMPMQSQ